MRILGALTCLPLTLLNASCGSAAPIVTVPELVGRIDALNGKTVQVRGFLGQCAGYDCRIYASREDFVRWEQWFAATVERHEKPPFAEPVTAGIGSGEKFDFDAKAASLNNSYVLITGKATNSCRYQGRSSCTDRSPDLEPTNIEAWHPPATVKPS